MSSLRPCRAKGIQPRRTREVEPRHYLTRTAAPDPLVSLSTRVRCEHATTPCPSCGPWARVHVSCASCMSCSCMSCIRAAGRCLAGRKSAVLHVRSPAIARACATAPLVSLASSTPTPVTCDAVCCRWLVYSRTHHVPAALQLSCLVEGQTSERFRASSRVKLVELGRAPTTRSIEVRSGNAMQLHGVCIAALTVLATRVIVRVQYTVFD